MVTKKGRPVVRILLVSDEPGTPLFGFLKNSLIISGDIISPLEESWDVEV